MPLQLSFQTIRVIALAVGLCVFAPATAAAQGETSEPIEYMALAVPVGLSGLTFMTADIAYAARGDLLTTGWAIGQLINATAELAFGAAGMVIVGNDQGGNFTLTLAITGLVTGTWHVVHSIWSLVAGHPAPNVAVAAVPIDEGGLLTMSGRF